MANGFHYDIEYWEIWNEPDNYPDTEENAMWRGTKEQFFELYQISASYLKSKFPKLKFGGYASCGFYAIAEKEANPYANVSPRSEYFIEFFTEFLTYISNKEHSAPLDFFSWHSYFNVKENIIYSNYCRETLDKFGFTYTEQFLNEWNPGIINRGKLIDASNISANMLALQNTSLDMMMYYDLKYKSSYCGLYDPLNCNISSVVGVKKCLFKAYYSFKAWNVLYRLKNQIEVAGYGDNIYAVGASDGKNKALLITNNSNEKTLIRVNNIAVKEILLISEKKDLETIKKRNNIKLKPYEIFLIKFI